MDATTKTNTETGTCQICERTCKLPKGQGKTSLHGYKRPGHGWINGSCFGAHELPYEQSCDRLTQYNTTILQPRRAHLVETIERYTARAFDEVIEINVRTKETKTYRKGERQQMDWGSIEMFAAICDRRKMDAESELRAIDREITRVGARICSWVPAR